MHAAPSGRRATEDKGRDLPPDSARPRQAGRQDPARRRRHAPQNPAAGPGRLALPPPFLARTGPGADLDPDRPIRMLVGFAAGGSTDTTARIVAQAVTPALGQSVLGEPQWRRRQRGDPGGGARRAGRLYAGHGLDGDPCGNQSLDRTLPFHVAKDFSAVSLVALSHSLLVGHPPCRCAA